MLKLHMGVMREYEIHYSKLFQQNNNNIYNYKQSA